MVEPSGVTLVGTLVAVLVVAHALGALAARLGFAPVVGELVTGLVLGPSLLGLFAPGLAARFVPVPEWLATLAFFGLVLLVLLAGTEVDLPTVRAFAAPTAAVAAGGFVVPFLAGFALGWLLPVRYLPSPELRLPFALLIATALSISAVPVAVRVLIDLDVMDHRVAQLTLTAAVAIDAAGWVALTVVGDIARAGQPDFGVVTTTVLALAGFGLVAATVGDRVVAAAFALTTRVDSPALSGFSAAVLVGFAATAGALALGLEAVVGAFVGGVLVARRLEPDAARTLQAATLGLFAPLFFASAGLRADLTALASLDALAVGLLTLGVAIAGKVAGVFLGAAVTEFSRGETWCLAIGLNARGAMEIIVAAVGLALGVLTPLFYAVIVLVAVVTSVMTPPLLRRAFARLPDSDGFA